MYFMDSKMPSFIKLVNLILNLVTMPLHWMYDKILRCLLLSEESYERGNPVFYSATSMKVTKPTRDFCSLSISVYHLESTVSAQ